MRFSIAATTAISLFGAVLAQDNNVVTIQVGSTQNAQGGIFQFIPNTVTATNGTVINFQYTGMPGNHSITQSTFNAPCTPVQGGFDSGNVFLPNPGLTPIPQWNLTITDDTRPIWFFCKALQPQPHCIAGMVGVINPPTTGANTLEAFQQNARDASVDAISQNANGLSGVGAVATARPDPIPSGATPFPAISTNTSPTGGSGTNTNTAATPNNTNAGGNTGGALGLSSAGVGSSVVTFVVGLTAFFLA